jgi:hypothetical protein
VFARCHRGTSLTTSSTVSRITRHELKARSKEMETHMKWLSREIYYPTHDGPAQLPPAQKHTSSSTNLPAAAYPDGEADERPYSWLGGRVCEPASARAVARNGLTPTRGHSAGYDGAYVGRRYAGEITDAALARGHAVAEVEHPDAATAVAAAATAVAQANGLDPHTPVIIVVAEDVRAACDEDGGF